jgi:hypothetical protein
MRSFTIRVLGLVGLLAATLVAGSAYALASGQAAAVCPQGQVGLTLHWVDAQDASFCAVADGLQGVPVSSAIIGLIVRGPDDTVSTVEVAPAPAPAPEVGADARVAASSRSTSSSSSTTCVNGHCTTTSTQLVCVDGNCSSQP